MSFYWCLLCSLCFAITLTNEREMNQLSKRIQQMSTQKWAVLPDVGICTSNLYTNSSWAEFVLSLVSRIMGMNHLCSGKLGKCKPSIVVQTHLLWSLGEGGGSQGCGREFICLWRHFSLWCSRFCHSNFHSSSLTPAESSHSSHTFKQSREV